MRAILECYWLANNTFVMPNDELGFSLREMKDIIGLPILGELYEEHVPLDNELQLKVNNSGPSSFCGRHSLNIPRRVELGQSTFAGIMKVAPMKNTELSANS